MADWIPVVCGMCARRYGVDVVKSTFRADMATGVIEVRNRTRSSTRKERVFDRGLLPAGQRTIWFPIEALPQPPITHCDHSHVFDEYIDESLGHYSLRQSIQHAVITAARAGSSIAILDPGGQPRSESIQALRREMRQLQSNRRRVEARLKQKA